MKGQQNYEETKELIDTCNNNLPNNMQIFKRQIDSLILNIAPVRKDLMNYSSQGGESLLYIIDSDTLFAMAIFYGELGKAEEKFYCKDNTPVLYEKTAYFYRASIYEESQVEIIDTEKDLIIVQNYSVVKWCHFGKEIPVEDYDFMSDKICRTYSLIRNPQKE
jgi:hypothetical protein